MKEIRKMKDRSELKNIVRIANKVFVDASNIDENTSADSIPGWDSMGNLNLIIALEEEYDIEFDDEDLIKMNSIKKIHKVIINKVND